MVHPYVSQGALGIAILPGLFGINSIFRPEATLRGVHFPVPSEPTAQKLAFSLLRILSVRNVSVSTLLGLIWLQGDERLLGLGMITTLAMCVVDGFVSRSLIGGGEWNHWCFAPIAAGVSAALLGWFD